MSKYSQVCSNLSARSRPICVLACFILVLGGGMALAAGSVLGSVISAVSCSTPGASLATGTAACTASGYGYASATVTDSIAVPASASQPTSIDVNSFASAMLGGARGISSMSTAQSSSQVGITFDTTGPLRSGWLDLIFTQSAWTQPNFGQMSESLNIGSTYSVTPGGSNLSVFIPIELGTQFGFDYLESITANGDAGSGSSSADIGADIAVQAFESDQTTAVPLFDPAASPANAVPEPNSIGMMMIATTLSLFLINKARA